MFNGEYRKAPLMDSSYKASAGDLISTAEDLARFAISVQNGVLIRPETLRQMFETQKTRDGLATGYGYGWYVDSQEDRRAGLGLAWWGAAGLYQPPLARSSTEVRARDPRKPGGSRAARSWIAGESDW